MDALLTRIHNFITLLVRGMDRVCACGCGSHQVYRVIPYDPHGLMEFTENKHFLDGILTRMETCMLIGLLLGLCISWFLWNLDRLWRSLLRYWRRTE